MQESSLRSLLIAIDEVRRYMFRRFQIVVLYIISISKRRVFFPLVFKVMHYVVIDLLLQYS